MEVQSTKGTHRGKKVKSSMLSESIITKVAHLTEEKQTGEELQQTVSAMYIHMNKEDVQHIGRDA